MKLSLTALAAMTLVLAGPASAVTVVVDNFNLESQAVSAPDYLISVSAGSVGAAGLRTVAHELISGSACDNTHGCPSPTTGGGLSYAVVGPEPDPLLPTGFFASNLSSSNSDAYNSKVTVSWTLPSNFLGLAAADPLALKFDRISLDQASTATLSFAATSWASTLMPATVGVTSFLLSADQLAAINGGGELMLSFTGPVGYDLAIDNVRFETPSAVPEVSTSLMWLAGLAGMLSLRRRTARQGA